MNNPASVKIRIGKGAVQVQDCWTKVIHEDCVVAEINCVSKYPVIRSMGDDGRHLIVLLGATKTTLYANEKYKGRPTKITFTELSREKWYIHSASEGGRYTINVTFLRNTP